MLEILNTVAAIGTFIVIATTAIAAVVQLRHMRASNQLEYLCVMAEDYMKAHGNSGTYPKHVRRLKLPPFSVPPPVLQPE